MTKALSDHRKTLSGLALQAGPSGSLSEGPRAFKARHAKRARSSETRLQNHLRRGRCAPPREEEKETAVNTEMSARITLGPSLRALCLAAAILLSSQAAWSNPTGRGVERKEIVAGFKHYPTKYYEIISDLPAAEVEEAAARMTSLAEEYARRTSSFARRWPGRMPFYLFGKREDYVGFSGMPRSAGLYNGRSLLADGSSGKSLWHTVQHEAFHQFAAATITPRIPTWMNEGLAEYFAEGVWTGDAFFTGAVPANRLRRIQRMIEDRKLVPFETMFNMSPTQWSGDLKIDNYDQAWSMVHFLVHGDDEKYQKALGQCIADMARGKGAKDAFVRQFGSNMALFQERYEQWWAAQTEECSAQVTAKVHLATLTSALARAHVSGQKFADMDELLSAIGDDTIKDDTKKFMPKELIPKAARAIGQLGECKLEYVQKKPQLSLTQPDGTKLVGTFIGLGKSISSVNVTVTKPKAKS